MTATSRHWFRGKWERISIGRRPVRPNVKTRRLSVERIEDRLLLSVCFQANIVWQLEGLYLDGDYCLIGDGHVDFRSHWGLA